MSSGDERKQVNRMIGICAAVIVLAHIAFWKLTMQNFHSALFTIGDLVFAAFFIIYSYRSYKQEKENETKTTSRAAAIGFAAANFVWVCGWAAYLNELVK